MISCAERTGKRKDNTLLEERGMGPSRNTPNHVGIKRDKREINDW